MAARLTTNHLQELRLLHARCLFIIDFVHERSSLGELASPMRDAVQTAFAMQNRKGLRMVARDLAEMADSLAGDVKRELDRRLEHDLALDLAAEAASERAALESVVARGRIRNEREYRLAQSAVDRGAVDASLGARLSPLLATYSA